MSTARVGEHRVEVGPPVLDLVQLGQLGDLGLVAPDQDRFDGDPGAVGQLDPAGVADRQDRAQQMLPVSHPAGNPVHGDTQYGFGVGSGTFVSLSRFELSHWKTLSIIVWTLGVVERSTGHFLLEIPRLCTPRNSSKDRHSSRSVRGDGSGAERRRRGSRRLLRRSVGRRRSPCRIGGWSSPPASSATGRSQASAEPMPGVAVHAHEPRFTRRNGVRGDEDDRRRSAESWSGGEVGGPGHPRRHAGLDLVLAPRLGGEHVARRRRRESARRIRRSRRRVGPCCRVS